VYEKASTEEDKGLKGKAGQISNGSRRGLEIAERGAKKNNASFRGRGEN